MYNVEFMNRCNERSVVPLLDTRRMNDVEALAKESSESSVDTWQFLCVVIVVARQEGSYVGLTHSRLSQIFQTDAGLEDVSTPPFVRGPPPTPNLVPTTAREEQRDHEDDRTQPYLLLSILQYKIRCRLLPRLTALSQQTPPVLYS